MGHLWGLGTLEVLWVTCAGSSCLALCRTVASEKRYEYELAESIGREIWRKEKKQELEVIDTTQKRCPRLRESATNKERHKSKPFFPLPGAFLHVGVRANVQCWKDQLREDRPQLSLRPGPYTHTHTRTHTPSSIIPGKGLRPEWDSVSSPICLASPSCSMWWGPIANTAGSYLLCPP